MQIIQISPRFPGQPVGGRRRGRPWRPEHRSPTRRRRRRPRSGSAESSPASASRPSTSPRSCCAPKASPTSATCHAERSGVHAGVIARGEIDFGLIFAPRAVVVASMPANRSRCWPACIPAASSCSRTSPSAPSSTSRARRVGVPRARLEPAPATCRSWRPTSGSTPRRTSIGSRGRRRQPDGAVRRGQDRCLPRLSARAAGAARPQDRPRRSSTARIDRPWSQYFCCMLAGNTDFVREHPVATKRVLRAILKATDLCAAEPERPRSGWSMAGSPQRYDYALQTLTELPYGQLARVRPGGLAALLRAAPARGGHDQRPARTSSSPRAPTGAS